MRYYAFYANKYLRSDVGGPVKYQPNKKILHPDYTIYDTKNDLCLLYVEEKIEFDDSVTPACIPPASAADIKVGTTCFVAGWGKTSYVGNNYPVALQELAVQKISSADCNAAHAYGQYRIVREKKTFIKLIKMMLNINFENHF